MVKHEGIFYIVCAVVFISTVGLFLLILLAALNCIDMTTGQLIFSIICFIIAAFMSFACACILRSYYDDYKSRRINQNARWKRSH